MEIKSHFNNNKNLLAVQDKNTIMIWDFRQGKYIQNYELSKTTITKFYLSQEIKNKDSLNLIVSDVKGYFYVYNINKNSLVSQFKIHDAPIIDFKISQKNKYNNFSNVNNSKNIIFSLDKNTTVKMFDFFSGEVIKSFKLMNKSKGGRILFDLDCQEKYLVFSKNSKIKLLSLESLNNGINNKISCSNIGMHSQEIFNLKFSSDSKFILSSTFRDYIISVWHLKNKDSPLFTLQNSFFPIDNYLLRINKGVYHAISISREIISIYKIDLKNIDPNEPVKPKFCANFPQKNLLGIFCDDIAEKEKKDVLDYSNGENKSFDKIISAFYGNTFNIQSKNINYLDKKNQDNIKEAEISVTFKENNLYSDQMDNIKNGNLKNVIVNNTKLKVLNEVEMATQDKNNSNDNQKYINTNSTAERGNIQLTASDTKISLLNIIRNSLINNDVNQFEWALDQKDFKVIENTIDKMNSELIARFINKVIDILQSNIFYKKNLIPWLKLIFEKHFTVIINLPNQTIENFNIIKLLISNRIQYKEKLEHLNKKINLIFDYYEKNNTNNGSDNNGKYKDYQPLLDYYESDDEESLKKNKEFENQLKRNQIIKTNIENFKAKRLGRIGTFQDELNFEGDSDIDDNFEQDHDEDNLFDDGMSIEEDENFKKKPKAKQDIYSDVDSENGSDEVSLD